MSTQINYCGLDANNSSVAPVQRKEEKYSWAANRGGWEIAVTSVNLR